MVLPAGAALCALGTAGRFHAQHLPLILVTSPEQHYVGQAASTAFSHSCYRDKQVAEKKARELAAKEGEVARERAAEGERVRALQATQVPARRSHSLYVV